MLGLIALQRNLYKAKKKNAEQIYEEGASYFVRKDLMTKIILVLLSAWALSLGALSSASADDTASQPSNAKPQKADNQRNFYNVLNDLLGDFEFDLKNGDVLGLKDLSIRNITTSENVPSSFKSHIEKQVCQLMSLMLY